jgi:hypothetical protein
MRVIPRTLAMDAAEERLASTLEEVIAGLRL